jgi:hypothetical protein
MWQRIAIATSIEHNITYDSIMEYYLSLPEVRVAVLYLVYDHVIGRSRYKLAI